MISLYIAEDNGQYTKLAEAKEISSITGETLSPSALGPCDSVTVFEPFTATYDFSMSRKGLRVLAKTIMIPEYKITEWVFPKKKKRGTMRRRRKGCLITKSTRKRSTWI